MLVSISCGVRVLVVDRKHTRHPFPFFFCDFIDRLLTVKALGGFGEEARKAVVVKMGTSTRASCRAASRRPWTARPRSSRWT
jgi:hypothetical protein